MVLAKTQIRSRLESENAQREKKISQLNEFIARFSAGTRSSQVTSRKKEVERLQTTELARSNIARPYIRFDQNRPSGKYVLEFEGLQQRPTATSRSSMASAPASCAAKRSASWAATAQGKTTMLKSLLANQPDFAEKGFTLDAGNGEVGPRSADRLLSAGQHRRHRARHHRARLAPPVRRQSHHGRHPRHPRPDAFPRRRRPQADRRAFRRRSRAPALLQADAASSPTCSSSTSPPTTSTSKPSTRSTSRCRNTRARCCWSRTTTTCIDEVATRIWHFDNGAIEDFKGPYEEYQQATAATR